MNHKPINLTVINHIKQPRGRNQPCLCGSGRKFKACCWRQRQTVILAEINGRRDAAEQQSQQALAGV